MASLGDVSFQVLSALTRATHAPAGEVVVPPGPNYGWNVHPDGSSGGGSGGGTKAYVWVT